VQKHIFLTGFMGSGKSTIGKKLARSLALDFVDTDDKIEKDLGKRISDIFKFRGEGWFREYEQKVVNELVRSKTATVIALGGGTLLSEKNQQTVQSSGILIYIKSSPEEIWKRIKHSTRRPLLRRQSEDWSRQKYFQRMAVLMAAREPGYRKAQLVIDRDGKEVEDIVREIKEKLTENRNPEQPA
jgi:shikimate kinase